MASLKEEIFAFPRKITTCMKAFCFVLLASLFFFVSTDAVSLYPFTSHTKLTVGPPVTIALSGRSFQMYGRALTSFSPSNEGKITFQELAGDTVCGHGIYPFLCVRLRGEQDGK